MKKRKKTMKRKLKQRLKRAVTKSAKKPAAAVKGRLDKKKLGLFNKILLEKKKTLMKEVLKKYSEGKEYIKDDVKDTGDMASDSYENELLYGLGDNERQYLEEVDGALERIKSGAYGTCFSCGKKISLERLKALPFARLCVSCQQTKEK